MRDGDPGLCATYAEIAAKRAPSAYLTTRTSVFAVVPLPTEFAPALKCRLNSRYPAMLLVRGEMLPVTLAPVETEKRTTVPGWVHVLDRLTQNRDGTTLRFVTFGTSVSAARATASPTRCLAPPHDLLAPFFRDCHLQPRGMSFAFAPSAPCGKHHGVRRPKR